VPASKRILVVEDDLGTNEVLVEALKQLGYEVAAATTVADASARQDFDLALLDLHLSDGSGLHVLKAWRERGHDAPVLIITADRAARAIDRALLSLDAWDYLPKPFDLDSLEGAVRDALARANERHSIERRLPG
jgi:DNA-binding response OmpR family regulator